MRRILLTAGVALALSLTSAGAALAHGHAASRHARRHHKHHAHIVMFVPSHSTSSSTTAPTTPTTTEEAATVASFANGVLTLKLPDGSTVSGRVTEETSIACRSATGEQQEGEDDQGEGDDNHDGPGPSGFGGNEGDDMQGSSQGESGDDDGDDDNQSTQGCGTSALVEGAKVAEAELRVGSGGAVWEKVELFS